MKDLGHGANVEQMARMYNKNSKDIIDFSSNINPNVIQGLEERPEFIIPGNGATEIIYLLMKSIDKRIAILNPTFSEYERSARLNNLDVINLNLDESNEFEIDLNNIKENINKFDSLFVCNPNNPNGKVKNLEKLLDIIVDNNKLLIVDETFMEFVEEEEKYSLVKYVEKYPNLFILKAVTKFFGLPGIRLGYGLTSNNDIIEKIYNYKEPWTINSFADTLSNYIFKDQKYIEDSKEYYIDERNFMLSELKSINSIHVYDTDTNFILIRLNDKRAKEIKVELLREGNILIRDASNFIGLDDRYIRIAIKSHKENELLIRHMKKLLGD
ncbi:pyridoxal phosphate-dependent aminotransferase [Romboutsia ilealis]|uniref:pyridoxal phosphate-dependent aminotransferase n=1 Tax=Romboutsia ilealis TaxID=1115758 RepID=UPI0025734761|nr:aminotransferase class I/II-fold pyridoxal phosphate-dependent enzyme [Romboutsia ilealis]